MEGVESREVIFDVRGREEDEDDIERSGRMGGDPSCDGPEGDDSGEGRWKSEDSGRNAREGDGGDGRQTDLEGKATKVSRSY